MRSLQHYTYYLGLLFITGLMVTAGLYVADTPGQQEQQGRWVMRTHELLEDLSMLAMHVMEAENGQRGYLLTGQAAFLQPYNAALGQIEGDLKRIEELTQNDPAQQAPLPLLKAQIREKLAELEQAVELEKNTRTKNEALYMILSGRGRDIMDSVHRQIDGMRQEQQSLLESRGEAWHEAALKTRALVLGVGILLYVCICTAYTLMYRELRNRRRLMEPERRTADTRRAEATRLRRIVEIQREVAAHHFNLQSAMQVITQSTQQLTGAAGGIVELVEGDDMVCRAASGTSAPHVGLRLKAEGSLSGLCVGQDKVLTCDDAETDARVDRETCRKVGLRSMVVVPLRHRGQVAGILKVMSPEPQAFTDEDVATLELMSGVLSAALSDASAATTIQGDHLKLAQANNLLAAEKDLLEVINSDLQELATTDGLTGLKNSRSFHEALRSEYQRALRYSAPLSLIMLDVDHFKQFNDTYGHPTGDIVLQRVAELIRKTARATDYIARYGGEEFAVILPETGVEGAITTAEYFRRAIADVPWEPREITVSIGVSTLDETIGNAAQFLSAADKALYASKAGGRNRVSHAKDESKAA